MTRAAAEAVLRTVRMIEQVPNCGLFTPDRKLPNCPVCEEDELWGNPGGPSIKNRFRCYRCSFEFACPNPSGPTVVAAALLSDGVIYTLPPPARHDAVMRMLGTGPHWSGTEKWKLVDAEQGFVSDEGYYLTRTQAYAIAKAAGQLIPRAGGYAKGEISAGPELFSEDLW